MMQIVKVKWNSRNLKIKIQVIILLRCHKNRVEEHNPLVNKKKKTKKTITTWMSQEKTNQKDQSGN